MTKEGLICIDYDDMALDCLIPYMDYVNNPNTIKPYGIPNEIAENLAKYLKAKLSAKTEYQEVESVSVNGVEYVPKTAKPELVELKNSNVRAFLRRRCPRSVPLDEKEIDSLAKDICFTFGAPPSRVPSVETIVQYMMDKWSISSGIDRDERFLYVVKSLREFLLKGPQC